MKKLFLALFMAMVLCGFNQQNANAMGLFYTDATYPITATGMDSKDLSQLKKGEASSNNILFCVELGDASIQEAAKNGGITKISHIDVNEKTVFIFFRKLTVTVYGE